MKTKSFITIFAAMFLSLNTVMAEETPIENLYSYKLKNGLSLYVAENHTVPLVYIEIAVKAGGVSQNPDNAGLFHLYEHMMFKGNKKYKTAEEIQSELTKLGVSNWNGSTAPEYVNYYFTIPSDKLEEGLDFWSQAIRNPLMTNREFEDEKQVVLSEITADVSDPTRYASYYSTKEMFYEAPWKTEPSGNPNVVQNATVAQLKDIQKKYYIPNNCALFVGGDVNPETVKTLAEKIYGSWKKGKDPWSKSFSQFDTDPFKNSPNKPVLRVVPCNVISDSVAVLEIEYRGPDAAFNTKDTYSADVLISLLADPQGLFKQSLINDRNLAIPKSDYISANYLTRKYLGKINFEIILAKPETMLAERVKIIYEKLPVLVEEAIPDGTSLSQDQLSKVRIRITNDSIYEKDTTEGLLSSLRFWWICTSENYYFTYTDNLMKVQSSDIEYFVEKYIKTKTPAVTLYINDELYEATLKEELCDYTVITEDAAYWWK